MALLTYLEYDGQKPLSETEIQTVEEKYQFRLPKRLRKIYLHQNGGLLEECGVSEDACLLAEVYPLTGDTEELTVKKLLKWQKQDKEIPMDYIPFCADEAGDSYYFHRKNHGIYYICHEFFDEFQDNPENFRIADSFNMFDEMILDLEEE